jgi:molecular chaperone IbpA
LRPIGAPPSASTGCSTCSRIRTSGRARRIIRPSIKLGDNDYRIELAVAGFKPDEIDITAQQNVLVVTGRKKDEAEEGKSNDYIYRGIATRSFERRFALADHIQVRGADLKDGLLAIELKREIPEAMKPRKISIGGSDQKPQQQTIEAEAEHA